jgi:hypothetical protein
MVCIIIYAGSIGLAASVLSMRGSPPVVTYVTYVDGNPYLVNFLAALQLRKYMWPKWRMPEEKSLPSRRQFGIGSSRIIS